MPRSSAWERRAHVGAWLFAIALFGYPVVGNVTSLLQLDGRVLSISFRIGVGMFALWTFLLPGRLALDPWRAALLLIFIAYILRLGYDMSIGGIDGADYALQFFLVGSLLPALAIWRLDAYDERRFARATLAIASTGCLMSLSGYALGAFGEADLTETTGRLSTVALNPVSLGYLAAGGLLAALAIWPKATQSARFVIAALSLVMLIVLLLTASKGPALILLSALVMWSFRRGLFVSAIVAAMSVFGLILSVGESPLAARVAASAEDLSTLDRLDLLEGSVRQIAAAPWFGSAFVELESGFYAHNILIEAAMSFGLPITVFLIMILARGTVSSWRLLGTEGEFVALLFFLGFASSLISSSIYGATVLWVSLVVVLGLTRQRAHRRRPSRAAALG
jgi:O-antigen ligase